MPLTLEINYLKLLFSNTEEKILLINFTTIIESSMGNNNTIGSYTPKQFILSLTEKLIEKIKL